MNEHKVQLEAILEGVRCIIPAAALAITPSHCLKLFVCGEDDVNLEQLRVRLPSCFSRFSISVFVLLSSSCCRSLFLFSFPPSRSCSCSPLPFFLFSP